jgi:acylpyruvate hydrolase
MKLATFTHGATTHIGVVDDTEIVDLATAAPELPRDMVAFLEAGAPAVEAARRAADGTRGRIRFGDIRLEAPIRRPPKFLAIGLNYADHVAELGGSAPEEPLVFLKLPSSAAPPNDLVRCPPVVKRLDYEGELAVVMGAGGRIAGYAVADDVSARDLQKREPQWTRAKGADGFCPYGPWITTAEEVEDPHSLTLRTWVNGELRQDSNTSNLIFEIPELVAFISETCTLTPGDLILTGTPSGVGQGQQPPQFLRSGDVVRVEIERLGGIEHAIA